jgi:hypothetical protein
MINWSFQDGYPSNLTAFRIYGDHIQGAIEVGPGNRSYEAHVSGGWGYRFQVSALFDDGNESFAEPVWAMAPMCEGVGFGFDLFSLLFVFGALFGIALGLVAVFLLLRRRRKG